MNQRALLSPSLRQMGRRRVDESTCSVAMSKSTADFAFVPSARSALLIFGAYPADRTAALRGASSTCIVRFTVRLIAEITPSFPVLKVRTMRTVWTIVSLS
jgi:hypothetical protein